MRRKGTPSVIRRGGTLQGDCPEHPACSSPSGGGCREATGEGEKCKASASRHFQPPVMIRASPSSAPVCALGYLPPLGEGRRRRGARGPHSALRATYPPCGARKMLQAYAFLCIFRPLRKRSPRFIRPWRREDSFSPCAGKAFVGRSLSVASQHLSPTQGEASSARPGFPVRRGGEGAAYDSVDFSFLYEHIDHFFLYCLNFSTLPSLLSFPISCIITISMLFCALQCEFHLRERYYHG